MNFFLSILFLFLGRAAADSLVLTSSNFTSTIAANRLTLVMFYAPWCGISKKILPEYEAAAAPLRTEGAVLAKVNCVNESDIYWSHNIKGFPTFKMFFDGHVIDYEHELEMDPLTYFVNRFTQGAVTRIDSDLDSPFGEFSQHRPIALYLSNSITAEFVKDFDVACKINNFAQCATSSDDSLALHFNVTMPAYVMMRFVDGKVAVEVADTPEMTAVADVLEWLNVASFPPLVENNAANQEVMFWRKRPGFQTHLVFFYDSSEAAVVSNEGDVVDSNPSTTLEIAAAIGNVYRKQCVVSYIDLAGRSTDEYVTNMLEDLEMVGAVMPNAMVINSSNKKVGQRQLKWYIFSFFVMIT